MKLIFTTIIVFLTLMAHAQTTLVPGENIVDKKWLSSQTYQMAWYALKDTMRFEIGKTTTKIAIDNKSIAVVTTITMKQNPVTWIDSTIANKKDLSPVYHSSYNAQRDMVLNFGPVVTGFYRDKINNNTTIIGDTTKEKYFDSNIYPVLLTWLPLQEGYKKDISIYDFKPGSKTGVIKATIHDVKKRSFQTAHSGKREVWVLTVSDEISGGTGNINTYYIDVATRKLWKQEIKINGRTMEMVSIEE